MVVSSCFIVRERDVQTDIPRSHRGSGIARTRFTLSTMTDVNGDSADTMSPFDNF